MLADELIANLLNIHNQQFLLSNNELLQLKGLQTLEWHDFIVCFLFPKNCAHLLLTYGIGTKEQGKSGGSIQVWRVREQAIACQFGCLVENWDWCLEVSNPKIFSNTQSFVSGFQEYVVLASIQFSTLYIILPMNVKKKKGEMAKKNLAYDFFFCHIEPCYSKL